MRYSNHKDEYRLHRINLYVNGNRQVQQACHQGGYLRRTQDIDLTEDINNKKRTIQIGYQEW